MSMNPGVVGAILGGLGVAFGAFGAHALKDRLAEDKLAIFEVGVRYQLVHALALLAVAALLREQPVQAGRCGWLFLLGVCVFSGSLYAMALGGPRWLGAVTPLGGLGLIAGWVSLALALRAN